MWGLATGPPCPPALVAPRVSRGAPRFLRSVWRATTRPFMPPGARRAGRRLTKLSGASRFARPPGKPGRSSASGLWDAQDELAEEVATRHDLVGAGGLGQVERLAHHPAQAAMVHHVHHRGEAAPAPGPAAHQRQGPRLEKAEAERKLAPRGGPGDDQPAA